MTYEIHLDIFNGPFDLLWHLIEKNQVDIYDIPIADIAEQYLAYLHTMEALDLEIASSFLLMAANLLAIKAKMLLPKSIISDNEEEVEDARQELVIDLLEYLRCKEAAQFLGEKSQSMEDYIPRPNDIALYGHLFAPENPLAGKTIADLAAAFADLLSKKTDEQKFLDIEGQNITIQDKEKEIKSYLRKYPQGLSFSLIFDQCQRKIEMVLTFLALLEMVRQHELYLNQQNSFGEIYLYSLIGDSA